MEAGMWYGMLVHKGNQDRGVQPSPRRWTVTDVVMAVLTVLVLLVMLIVAL
jgi:hypothetical protein